MTDYIPILAFVLIGIVLAYVLIFKVLGLRVINSNEVAVVEKWWSLKGSLKDAIIALNAEAGYSPDLLRGGIHFKSVFMYKIHRYPLITIPQGQIAYIFARDGQPLSPTQTLGKIVPEANNFQNRSRFLTDRRTKRTSAWDFAWKGPMPSTWLSLSSLRRQKLK